MKLVQAILTKNPCYTAGRKITVKGLMLHSVGCPQPKASVFINSWKKAVGLQHQRAQRHEAMRVPTNLGDGTNSGC